MHAARLPKAACVLAMRYTKTTFRGASGMKKGYDILDPSDEPRSELPRSLIRGYGAKYFEINNTIVNSSVLVLPYSFFVWSPNTAADITLDSIQFVSLVHPTIELLLLGFGKTIEKPVSKDIVEYFRKRGTVIEGMNSVNAAATFNVLRGEGRHVAAALVTMEPPELDPFAVQAMFLPESR